MPISESGNKMKKMKTRLEKANGSVLVCWKVMRPSASVSHIRAKGICLRVAVGIKPFGSGKVPILFAYVENRLILHL